VRDLSRKQNQCEPAGPLLAGADGAGAEAFAGAAGTSDCAEVGAAGTSDCGAGVDDAGALAAGTLAAGVELAGAELPAPAITPSVCCVFGVTP
jgi:hypothetical protein